MPESLVLYRLMAGSDSLSSTLLRPPIVLARSAAAWLSTVIRSMSRLATRFVKSSYSAGRTPLRISTNTKAASFGFRGKSAFSTIFPVLSIRKRPTGDSIRYAFNHRSSWPSTGAKRLNDDAYTGTGCIGTGPKRRVCWYKAPQPDNLSQRHPRRFQRDNDPSRQSRCRRCHYQVLQSERPRRIPQSILHRGPRQ